MKEEKAKKKPERRGEKPPYEPPRMVPLGEAIRGSGRCFSGSGDSGFCDVGGAARHCSTGMAG